MMDTESQVALDQDVDGKEGREKIRELQRVDERPGGVDWSDCCRLQQRMEIEQANTLSDLQ
jgi:hypothetical protein